MKRFFVALYPPRHNQSYDTLLDIELGIIEIEREPDYRFQERIVSHIRNRMHRQLEARLKRVFGPDVMTKDAIIHFPDTPTSLTREPFASIIPIVFGHPPHIASILIYDLEFHTNLDLNEGEQ